MQRERVEAGQSRARAPSPAPSGRARAGASTPARCASAALSRVSKRRMATLVALVGERGIAGERLLPAAKAHLLGQLAEVPRGDALALHAGLGLSRSVRLAACAPRRWRARARSRPMASSRFASSTTLKFMRRCSGGSSWRPCIVVERARPRMRCRQASSASLRGCSPRPQLPPCSASACSGTGTNGVRSDLGSELDEPGQLLAQHAPAPASPASWIHLVQGASGTFMVTPSMGCPGSKR